MQYLDLNGTWILRKKDSHDGINVTIPGTVLSGYLENGKIADPFYRLNEAKASAVLEDDFEFERTFFISAAAIKEKKQLLMCEGLDTICEIYINGMIVGRSDNMHRTWYFDANHFINEGENVIKVVCKSPHQARKVRPMPGREITYSPTGCLSGANYLRKAHSNFGWDWGPALADAGIWRNIAFIFYSDCRITDTIFTQHHLEASVRLDAKVCVNNATDSERQAVIRAKAPNGKIVTESATMEFGAKSIDLSVELDNPVLWWPNGLGDQNLYEITITVGGDEKYYRIGLRTFEVSREEDKWGNEFAFKVNGRKFFAMGADYIPEDAIYPHIQEEKMESLIKAAVRSNFNTLRIWGGGYYPSDRFYDLCDEYGIVIWQDMMFACNIYDVTETFEKNVVEEIKDNVRRLRHHPSLCLWCGNNEIEEAWSSWDGFMGHSDELKADYLKLFEDVIPKAFKEVDEEHFYWPSSPSSEGGFVDPNGEKRGDGHYWEVWHGLKPFSEYEKHCHRFLSEFGFESLPDVKTIAEFSEEDERNVFSEVMEAHQKNPEGNGKILYYISENFLYPKDFESFIYISQILQAYAINTCVTHLRRNRGRCMGTLYWQFNDNWPVASWSSIDYFGRWKALQYFAKRFYAPVMASLEQKEYKITPVICNETKDYSRFKIVISVKDFSFRTIYSEEFENRVDAMSVYREKTVDVAEYVKGREKDVFVEMLYTNADGRTVNDIAVFAPFKHLHLSDPELSGEMRETPDSYIYTLRAVNFAPFVEISLPNSDGIFDDNYFHITSNSPKEVVLKKEDLYGGSPAVNVMSLFDSF